jgi:hypothetical protein
VGWTRQRILRWRGQCHAPPAEDSLSTEDQLVPKRGAKTQIKTDWELLERDRLVTIDIEKLLAVERATVETWRTAG